MDRDPRAGGLGKAGLDLGTLLTRRAAVYATSVRSRPLAEEATIVASARENVLAADRVRIPAPCHRPGASDAQGPGDSPDPGEQRSRRQDPLETERI